MTLRTLLATILFCAVSAICAPDRAAAQEKTNEQRPILAMDVLGSGLAMHGAPKYPANARNLPYANPSAPKGGTLAQSVAGSFDSLNPFAIKGTAAQGLHLVFDRLMARAWDEPFTLYPLIAKSIDVPEDRSGITFHLDPRARFHDGSPVRADDVLFSWETLKTSGRPNMRRVYALAKTAEKLDERTVRFTFGPAHDRETVMIFAMMPVLSKAWWKDRSFDSALTDLPLGNGPYRIAKVDPGRRLTLERVPDYWAKDLPISRGLYNLDRMVYDYFRDEDVAFEAFKAGDLNFRREYDPGRWAQGYDTPAIRKGGILAESLPHGRPERLQAFIFNMRRPPFDDLRVRTALSQALDFEWINANLMHGQSRPIRSLYPNASLSASGPLSTAESALLGPAHKDNLPAEALAPRTNDQKQPPLRERLKSADKLLKSAGWVVRDGRRVNEKTGAPLTFELLTGAPEEEKLALAYAHTLKRLGITITIRTLDAAQFLKRLTGYDYDMISYFWISTLSPGTEQSLYWGCAAANEPGRMNYAGLCTPLIDSLSSAIANAKTYDDLQTHTRLLDRIIMAYHPFIPLGYAGVDRVARAASIKRPSRMPLYGLVPETLWFEKETAPKHQED